MDDFDVCPECQELEHCDYWIKCSNPDCENPKICTRCLDKNIFKVDKVICPCMIIEIDPEERLDFLEIVDAKVDTEKYHDLLMQGTLSAQEVDTILGSLCECSNLITEGRATVKDLMNELECYIPFDPESWTREEWMAKAKKEIKKLNDTYDLKYLCRECCTHEAAIAKQEEEDFDTFLLNRAGFKNKMEAIGEFNKRYHKDDEDDKEESEDSKEE